MITQDQTGSRSLSPTAIRQRRCRERRREGAVFIEMELGPIAIQVLARIGCLAKCDLKKPTGRRRERLFSVCKSHAPRSV